MDQIMKLKVVALVLAAVCTAACIVQVYARNVTQANQTEEYAAVDAGSATKRRCEQEPTQAVSLDIEKLINAVIAEYHKAFPARYYSVATIHFNGVDNEQKTGIYNLSDKAAFFCAVSDVTALDNVSSVDSEYVPRFLSGFPERARFKTFFLIVSERALKDKRFAGAFSAAVTSCRGLHPLMIVAEDYHHPVTEEMLVGSVFSDTIYGDDLYTDRFAGDLYRNFSVDQYALQDGQPLLIRDGFCGLVKHERKLFKLNNDSALSPEECFAQAYFNKAFSREVRYGSQQHIAVKLAKACNMTVSWEAAGDPTGDGSYRAYYCYYVNQEGAISQHDWEEERRSHYAAAPRDEIVCFLNLHGAMFRFNGNEILVCNRRNMENTFEDLVAVCKEAVEKKQILDGNRKFSLEENNLAFTYTMQQLFEDLKAKVGREFAVVQCDDKEKIAGIKPRGGKPTIVVLTNGQWQTDKEGEAIRKSMDTYRDLDLYPYNLDISYKKVSPKVCVLDREDYLKYNFWSFSGKQINRTPYHERKRIFTKDIRRVPRTKEAFLNKIVERMRNITKDFPN